MKKCPYCAEEIQDEAIKCRHCGEMLGEKGPDPAPTRPVSTPAPAHQSFQMTKPKSQNELYAVGAMGVFSVLLAMWVLSQFRGSGISVPSVAPIVNAVAGPSEHSFTIQVTGSGAFSGAVMVMKGGKSEQRTVEGTAPTSYSEQGTIVSVSFQKKQAEGTLGVTILRDGQSVATQSTSAEYGVVSAATQ